MTNATQGFLGGIGGAGVTGETPSMQGRRFSRTLRHRTIGSTSNVLAMKSLTPSLLDALVADAKASPRRRANLNLHVELDDPVQRLAIAMEPDTVVFPHRHPQTFELLYPLRGRFLVLQFDEEGVVTERTVLGEACAVLENPAGVWHAVLSLDSGGVIFEVKQGPYVAVGAADTAPWSVTGTPDEAKALLAWYGVARVGERFGGAAR